MKRSVYPELQAWLADERRKPLILRGARQVDETEQPAVKQEDEM